MSARRRLYEILESAPPGDRTSRLVDTFIMALIALNVIALVLETEDSIARACGPWFQRFEYVSVGIFTVEYLLRAWSCVENVRYQGMGGRLRYLRTPLALVDLLAVLPTYLPMVGLDLRFMRMLRLAQMFRVLKLVRYAAALRMFTLVLAKKRAELVVTMFLVLVLLLFSSSLMYFVEKDTGKPHGFDSIPEAMWWGIITLTTVGYGDVHPETGLGKLLGAVIAILGIGMVALPTGILGAAFVEEMQANRRAQAKEMRERAEQQGEQAPDADRQKCPHCGKPL